MTFRLVALMSVVLLLSLAAFGLLMGHYQQEFMDELPRTASAVGQAALRTLDWREDERAGAILSTKGQVALGRKPVEPESSEQAADEPPSGAAGEAQAHQVVVTQFRGSEQLREKIETIRHVITTSTDDNEFTVREQLVYPADAFPSELPGHQGRLEACLQDRLGIHADTEGEYFIDVGEVHAKSDPMYGLILTIPKLTPTVEAEKAPGKIRYEFHTTGETTDGADVFFARRDEIQLPIQIGQYQELFRKVRSRSLFLFLGVFLVGSVLSTGLATRFTRPIRQLDAGIRQLSEGDLDVTVDVQGKGEIGRLARAFNEMAGKLRANRERAREMVRREKLSALGRLASGVAHDVRNPLHSIGLTLQHMSDTARPSAPDRAGEFDRSLDVIRGEIHRLDQLVSNFLRFAKSERHERERVDLAELLRDTVCLVQKEAERRGIQLDLAVDEATPPVRADGEAIRSAILNLVLNSFEAMPDGGRLTVRLGAGEQEALLEVADTGRGIPEEDQEHVFDFAYTTRDGGHGLGLAMVHHCVVEEHGGRVSLESRPGEGTRVRLALPANGVGSA